ncbi:CIC11C00000003889 [Sungouiella intermedia]|uniref:CIC11C00000003889 n=1 Tax=Sungouiella intermedia TaxID=45354 RepID=A0A1L0E375_9ASCO|nr:CIC11C00000003889 [[Candida] intermedia]
MSSTVVPGQYLEPELKPHHGENGREIFRYYPGKGTAILHIQSGSTMIPVIVATVLGKQLVQEITPREKGQDSIEDEEAKTENAEKDHEDPKTKTDDSGEDAPVRNFLVSVVSGNSNEFSKYAREIEASASEAVSATSTNLPREGDEVLVKITRLNPKQAFCEVLCVYGHGNVLSDGGEGANGTSANFSLPLGGGAQLLSSYGAVASFQGTMLGAQPLDVGETFKGIIRSQDVRSTDRDKVKIADCFRPGDVVKAAVLSLGDGSNYYLTTARNDLGVVFAKSEGGAGDLMVAIDWETMVCEKTGVVEKRKCAKLFN